MVNLNGSGAASGEKDRRLCCVQDYEPLIGSEAVDRILKKAHRVSDFHVTHVNSTYYGGGVAEILSALTLLMNGAGVDTDWRVLQGAPDFFSITKKIHNALQGADINMTTLKRQIFEEVISENAARTHLEHSDMIVIHDPQPLPMIGHYRKKAPWVWQCHLDLTQPNRAVWDYLLTYIDRYDAMILSLEDYRQDIRVPQFFFYPAISPFTIKNRELSGTEVNDRLNHYGIPTDLPLIVQVSRFDKWKDPRGVIEAFKIARREADCTLVLMGDFATDDPEGAQVYESIMSEKEDRILIVAKEDTSLVNALQRKAAVVLQKSVREGFGLTVTEAMWKGTPVIGGKVGGIRHQIEDGKNGFLVSTIEEAAGRIVQLLKDEDLRHRIGEAARRTVQQRFLMSRLFEQYLDLLASSRATFHFN